MTEKNHLFRNVKDQVELLRRHAEILETLAEHGEPMGILKLSKRTNYPPHRVRYSLRELENANIVVPTTKGSKIRDEAKPILRNFHNQVTDIEESINDFHKKMSSISTKL